MFEKTCSVILFPKTDYSKGAFLFLTGLEVQDVAKFIITAKLRLLLSTHEQRRCGAH